MEQNYNSDIMKAQTEMRHLRIAAWGSIQAIHSLRSHYVLPKEWISPRIELGVELITARSVASNN